jgi:hypothetical protein
MIRTISLRLPDAFVILWTIFLAAAIWAHIPPSPQLPIWDTFDYYWKAYSFWSAIHSGHWFNPLNLAPTFRPPGTVLMSYPLGFDLNPRGFYFRSIFIPAALMILAAHAAAHHQFPTISHRWRVALTAVLFSTPSLFYYFAVIPRELLFLSWGMVDGFLTGVAALAAGAAWRSVREKSIGWTCATAASSGFCVLIKPSGALVAALIGIVWCALALAHVVLAANVPLKQRAAGLKQYAAGALLIAGVDVSILIAALSSAYLSHDNVASGLAAIAVMKADLNVPISSLWRLIHAGPGDGFVLWTALGIVIPVTGLLSAKRSFAFDERARLSIAAALAAIVALGFGLWFWLVGSGGGTEVRYGMPFFAIAMVWMVPAVTEFWRYAPRIVTSCAAVGMLAIPIDLALLLVQHDPPQAWQKLAGISLSPGVPFAAMEDFRRFVDEARTKAAVVYGMTPDEATEMMSALAAQRLVFHPNLPPVLLRQPRDFERTATYRIDEVVSSDFLLFRPEPHSCLAPQAPANSFVPSFKDENATFVCWASRLEPQDGIEVAIDSASARLLRVVDRSSLRKSVLRMILGHKWRPVFTAANSALFWFSETDLVRDDGASALLLENIRFGDLFEVRKLSATPEGDAVHLKLWWRPLRQTNEEGWVFFIHVVDADGKILKASELKITPMDPDPGAAFALRRLDGVITLPEESRRLAVGFYRKNEMLPANAGTQDWNGQGVLVSIP